jgi:hypothetical protein
MFSNINHCIFIYSYLYLFNMFKKFNLPHIINMLYVTHQPISPANLHSSIIKIRPSVRNQRRIHPSVRNHHPSVRNQRRIHPSVRNHHPSVRNQRKIHPSVRNHENSNSTSHPRSGMWMLNIKYDTHIYI